MTKLTRCECGFLAGGETDEQVVCAIEEDLRTDHPAVLAGIDRSELFGWIEEGYPLPARLGGTT